MSLNEQVSAERLHIGFFGLRNAGKSSLVNAVTGQNLAIVSETKGTTTDPVKKAMELLPLGPVVIIDTPGLDDEGTLGELRVRRAKQVLNYADIAILVVDAAKGMQAMDHELVELFKAKQIRYIIAYNKCDLLENCAAGKPESGIACNSSVLAEDSDADSVNDNDRISPYGEIYVSAEQKTNIYELKEMIGRLAKKEENQKKIVADLISPGDFVVLVTPIDSAAPKGRLILPQQQTIRDILDAGAIPVVTRETELPTALAGLNKKPSLVITDSQAFGRVSRDVPKDILLTSFSILFARYKGDLSTLVGGAAALDHLKDGDTVLISEGCTHHRQCGDIGTVKLPNWIRNYTKKEIQFAFTSGTEFPDDLTPYALVIHCGGCMLNEREMKSRIRYSEDCKVPMTNYGTAIAKMHGILERSLEVFPQILAALG